MFCNYCGESNPDDAVFCSKCGKRTVHEHAAAPARAEAEAPHSAEAVPDVPTPPDFSTPTETTHARAHTAEPQRVVAATGKGGRVLWAVGGLVLLVAIIGAVAITKTRNGSASSDGAPPGSTLGSSSTPGGAPGGASTPDSPPPSNDPGGAPGSATPAGQGTVVGTWKTPVPLMADTNLELTADGHYHLKTALAEETGTYVFMDGNLQLKPDGLFDNSLKTWQCQLSGDSMSIIEPDGAAHIYTRVN